MFRIVFTIQGLVFFTPPPRTGVLTAANRCAYVQIGR